MASRLMVDKVQRAARPPSLRERRPALPGRHIDWRGKWERLLADSRRQVEPETLPFPTDAQLDLLKAALLPADQAAPAWRRWKGRGLELDTISGASFRLLGRLWANREAAGLGPEDRVLLRGVYRKAFVGNVAKLGVATKASRVLADAGIPVLFIKGAALIATSDASLGMRTLADVDILIPRHDFERAASLLMTAGYTATYEHSHGHSWHCTSSEGCELDVHWRAFKPAGDDSMMFETALTATLLGSQVLVPSAAESLLVAVANAFWLDGAPLRWIADSMLILDTNTIDWDLVLRRADRPGLLPGLTAGLEYLAVEFGAPVPAFVLDELRRRPVGWRARAAYWAATHGTLQGLTQLEAERAERLHDPSNDPRPIGLLAAARAVVRHGVVLAVRKQHRMRALRRTPPNN